LPWEAQRANDEVEAREVGHHVAVIKLPFIKADKRVN